MRKSSRKQASSFFSHPISTFPIPHSSFLISHFSFKNPHSKFLINFALFNKKLYF